jgi:membrane fusion protein, adhesin transport system
MKIHYQDEEWNYKLVIYPMIAFVVVFFIWATFTQIDEVVKGKEKLYPQDKRKFYNTLKVELFLKF